MDLIDIENQKVINSFHDNYGFNSIDFKNADDFFVSSSQSGCINIWNIKSGNILASLYSINKNDWVAVTPDGKFDGSPGGLKELYYVQDMKPITLDAFYEKFYTPGLLQKVMNGEIVPGEDRGQIFFPPSIELKSPKANDVMDRDLVQIKVELKDEGGGIDEIRLYQNDKLIEEKKYGFSAGEFSTINKNFNVSLLPGINNFKVSAFGTDRTESYEEFSLELDKEVSKQIDASSNLHVFAIGINEYENSIHNINYGKPDAQAFVNAISKKSRTIFKDVNLYEIYDGEAVKSKIDSVFKIIAKNSNPNDAFVFYYAGHGFMLDDAKGNPNDYYFILHDVTGIGNDALVRQKGISADELKEYCKNIKAQKQLLVLDACHSGAAIEKFKFRGYSEEKAIKQLARSAGTAVLASAGSEQVSTEFDDLGHGVFTYALLKALDGEADNGDGKITVREMDAYLNDKVPELTEKYRGKKQYPNSGTTGNDFPVVICK